MVREINAGTPLAREYGDDAERFVLECINWRRGEGPTAYQRRTLREIPKRRRIAVRSPHGSGKTALAAWLVLWFALTREGRDWKAPCTASAWRQLTQYLFPEIRKWARRLRWDKLGRGPFDLRSESLHRSLKLKTGEAFAVASDTPALMEGAHATHLLYIFDEAKAIPIATWDAAEGALASGNALVLAISTPGEPQGRFYEIHSRKPGHEDWSTQHVTLEECIAAGRVSEEWAEQRKAQWGKGSAVYQNRVLGEFASSEEDGIIALSWVEAANERWRALQASGDWGEFTAAGVDVARSGVDRTVIALRFGEAIKELRRPPKQDTMETTGTVAGILKAHGGRAVVDVIGIGAGVVDRLREQREALTPVREDADDDLIEATPEIIAFNASERTDATDKPGVLGFVNKRSAAWWNLRELLDPASGSQIALPPDDLLTGDLTAPHWRVMSGGKIQIEGKDEIKKRLGRSTDDGDAVMMAFWEESLDDAPRITLL